ncbi:MAG: hypothetical protein ACK4MU_09065, partial [Thermomonas sp.]
MEAQSLARSEQSLDQLQSLPIPETLDPPDWSSISALAHQIVDDAVDHVNRVRERPVWRPLPEEVEALFRTPVPDRPMPIEGV